MTARQVLRALRRAGWHRHSQVGSHVTLKHPDRPGARVTVAVHPGETLKPATLKSILEQAGLDAVTFRGLV
ncbi:MAG: type II toxin-antitoxin system HicA family toxin [Chloroflexi bacterium]|nr:type II toxin-antitoxin system HicA family toxin [Chloroflexota bacterium]